MTPPVPAAPPAPPVLVDRARWLWIASAVVGMARFLVQLADRRMLSDEMRARQPGLSQGELESAVSGGIMFGLLMGALMVVVYVLLANRMARGRNWARIVLAVLGGGGIVLGVVRLIAVVSGLAAVLGLVVSTVDLLLGLVTMALDGAALTLMFLPPVSRYFRSQRSVSAVPPRVANGL